MNKAGNYIEQHRTAIFDWSVIGISFFLGFLFPTIKDFAASGHFSYWMLAAFLLYTIGAGLKHLPLSYRLTYSAKTPRPVPYIIFLLVGHWFIMLFVIMLSESAFRSIAGLPSLTEKNMASWQLILFSTTAAAFVTWMVCRTKSQRKSRKKYPAERLFYQEIVADLLLIAGVSILSFAFWEKGVMAMLGKATTQSISDIWFLFVFLTILFVFFYLPLRYLYFVEDRVGGRNRRYLLYIFGMMLLRALFEMLNL